MGAGIVRRRRRTGRLRRALFFGAALTLGLLAGARYGAQLARGGAVSSLAISGNGPLPAEELAALSQVRAGTPWRELDLEAVGRSVARHPWVREARAVALPAGRLLIEVTLREARAVAQLADGRRYVDETGEAFAAAGDSAAPQILGAETLDGEAGRPLLRRGLRLLDAAQRHGLPRPEAVEPETPAMLFERRGRALRVLIGGKLEERLPLLARLFDSRLPELARAREADLRFGDPLILRELDEFGELPPGEFPEQSGGGQFGGGEPHSAWQQWDGRDARQEE